MGRKSKYTKELLEPIVKSSYSMASVVKALGLKLTGGNYRQISSRIKYLGIDISHFKGQSWAKGLTSNTSPSLGRNKYSNEEVFSENSSETSGHRLTKRLLKLGWDYKCNICGISEWLGEKLTLHLDHINGIRNDNRFENLRFLCPNCHQQTETWGARNKKQA